MKLKGNVGTTIITAATAITFGGIAMQMGYSSFKIKAEKQLHILNSIRFSTIVQIGIEEDWVDAPSQSNSAIVHLSDVEANYSLSSTLKNPSDPSQLYHDDSNVVIQNDSGKLKFFVELIKYDSDHKYIYSNKEIHLLEVNDVNIN